MMNYFLLNVGAIMADFVYCFRVKCLCVQVCTNQVGYLCTYIDNQYNLLLALSPFSDHKEFLMSLIDTSHMLYQCVFTRLVH